MGEIYNVEALSKILSLSTQVVRRYIRDGKIDASKIGKAYLVTEKSLMQFLDENKYESKKKPAKSG